MEVPNRAGGTDFVAPDLVAGTLVQAWDRLQLLPTPAKRAAFALFAVAEVHPFRDGNGRVARVAMTAEHVAGEQARVLIPTISRNDYLNGLRRLTRQDRPDLFVEVVDRHQRFTAALDLTTFDRGLADLEARHAFVDANEAERRGLHLLLTPAGG